MKSARCRFLSAVSCLLVSFLLVDGILSTNVVTLKSILIYTTHEWLPFQPTVYFRCHGEKKIILPDVKVTNVLYAFKGEESWQPLTRLPSKKCKRCGIYEEDKLTPDDVFDEWELCPGDFVNETYTHFKAKEFNATFKCASCESLASGSHQTSPGPAEGSSGSGKKKNIAVKIVAGILGLIVAIALVAVGYIFWQKRREGHNQARFLKLFQEVEGLELETGNHDVVQDEVALKDAT